MQMQKEIKFYWEEGEEEIVLVVRYSKLIINQRQSKGDEIEIEIEIENEIE